MFCPSSIAAKKSPFRDRDALTNMRVACAPQSDRDLDRSGRAGYTVAPRNQKLMQTPTVSILSLTLAIAFFSGVGPLGAQPVEASQVTT